MVISLIALIMVCFMMELIFSRPDFAAVAAGFIPTTEIVTNPAMLYIALGILGATVMPHNLYLHSSIVQTRKIEPTIEGKREAIKFATIDSTVALMLALFVNAAILILSAAAFHSAGKEVAEIQDAYHLLGPMLGTGAASILFAVALLASGQNSTLTGTLAGQIVMEGFLNIRLNALAAPINYTIDCDRSRGYCDWYLWRERRNRFTHSQSSYFILTAFLCSDSACYVYFGS